jgi:hypothetical protein
LAACSKNLLQKSKKAHTTFFLGALEAPARFLGSLADGYKRPSPLLMFFLLACV